MLSVQNKTLHTTLQTYNIHTLMDKSINTCLFSHLMQTNWFGYEPEQIED